jgi:hypothetical protein
MVINFLKKLCARNFRTSTERKCFSAEEKTSMNQKSGARGKRGIFQAE